MNYKLSKSIWQNHAGLVVVRLSGSSLVQQQGVEMNRSLSCNHDDVRWTHRRHKWIPCPLFQTHESLIIHPASLGLPQIYKIVLHSAYICIIYCKKYNIYQLSCETNKNTWKGKASKGYQITLDKVLENPTPIYSTGPHISYLPKLDVFTKFTQIIKIISLQPIKLIFR